MGQGYHSRSPEEFKEYLRGLDKQKSKRKWRQVIILIDIFLLLIVAYLVFRSLNPGSFQDPTMSNKDIIEGYPMYLSLSREMDDLYQGYFLFVENNKDSDITLPEKDWSAEFRILTKEGVVCFSEPVAWETKKIPHFSKGFLYHSVSLTNLRRLPEECRMEIFDEDYSFYRSKFRYLSISFLSQMIITTNTGKHILQIKQKPYRISKP
jgi:hypothetical protein